MINPDEIDDIEGGESQGTTVAAEDTATETEELENEQEGAEDENDSETSEEGSEETEEDAEGAEEGAQVRKPEGRAQARIRRLNEEREKERQEKELYIRKLAEADARLKLQEEQRQEFQSAQARRAEEERLALLSPEDRHAYESDRKFRDLEFKFNQLQRQRLDDQDRASFHAKAQYDETYSKHAQTVEQMYQEGLARGVVASREDLHTYVLGQELKKNMGSKIAKTKEKASKRIESVTSSATKARGDVAGAKKGKAVEDRLSGVLI